MKTVSFWTDDYPRPADLPVAPALPERVDVAVVGGGYTGLAAARTLARGGASVAVLEQRQFGQGASAVNGGQTGPGLKKGAPALIERYGQQLGRELWQASLAAAHYLEQVIREEQIACDYARCGSLALAYRPTHYTALARGAEWLAREMGHEQTVVPPEQLRQEVGSAAYFGGLVEPLGGGLQPAKYVYGLAQAAARAGASLCEQAEVRAISYRPGGEDFHLETNRGRLQAGAVLLATNGYTGPLVPQVQRRVFPVGSYMITTEPLPAGLQQEISPRQRVMYDTKWFLNYFRLTPDGRMAMGGRNRLTPDLDLQESAGYLQQALRRIFPQLAGLPLTHSWSGRLGLTFDLLPHLGRFEGIYYALGYSGHGVTLATYLGHQVAELMAGRLQRSPFAEIGHPAYFFYRGRPWFLPLAAAYYRFLDRIS